jgi:hypothetical protein
MLPHYSPFKVAETFRMLAALAPGRIDLGVGRAPGSDQRTAFALQRDRSRLMPHDFPDGLAELTGYLDHGLPEDHAFASLQDTLPGGGEGSPDLWLLGSSLTLTLDSGGDVVIKLRPDLAPGMSSASPSSPTKASTTASSSTASSPASWRRAAIPPAPAWADRRSPT